jgi:hypothetical protein
MERTDDRSRCGRRGILGGGLLAAAAVATGVVGMTTRWADADSSEDKLRADGRLLIWRGLDAWRTESSQIFLGSNGIEAYGTQVGVDPVPYRLDYRLETSDGFITKSLVLTAAGTGWSRRLALRHDGAGSWTIDADALGAVKLPEPGGDPASLAQARDCDLGFSPLTNLMPIRRSGLNEQPGSADFVMAWVAVPDLTVVASAQRYEHVRRTATGSVVRYVDRGLFPGFEAELELDESGVALRYPDLAELV